MKILYLVRGFKEDSFFNNTDELYKRREMNTGNKIFETAVDKYISHSSNEVDYMWMPDFRLNLTDKQADEINNEYELLLLHLLTILRSRFYLKKIAI